MQLRAVIVWIYGGSFITGSADLKSFPPDYLLEKDIVYVSLNYRGGPLGNRAHKPHADFIEDSFERLIVRCRIY